MIRVVDENVIMCGCEHRLSFEKSDVKVGQEEYFVYGCEKNIEEYEYIVCPLCGRKVRV